MLSKENNDLLTRIEPGSRMGDYLRRYWHPIAGEAELDETPVKAVRLFGEDLVLFRDRSGALGLVGRHCPHRGADLAYGMREANGLRCNYHGWCFAPDGTCVSQPYEDALLGADRPRGVRATAYPVRAKAGLIWAFLGEEAPPLLPDWEPFSWPNGFRQVVVSEIPCNWLQCQENSIDPVHFEWMHENWGAGLKDDDAPYAARHMKLAFEEFDYGFVYRRIKEGGDASDENWTIGRVCLWPNAFFLGEHFEWRVPIDDENTLSVLWKYTRVPHESEPYVQDRVPAWRGPVMDEAGRWITSHAVNQDFLAWAGQGRIADRTREHLGRSDEGIIMARRRLLDELDRTERGERPKGLIADEATNQAVRLPMMRRGNTTGGFSREQILSDPARRALFTSFPFQAGQPEAVRLAFEEAIGLSAADIRDFDLATILRHSARDERTS